MLFVASQALRHAVPLGTNVVAIVVRIELQKSEFISLP